MTTFKVVTSNDAWAGVSHFLGNILTPIRFIIKDKEDGWESAVENSRIQLSGHLRRIISEATESGLIEDAAKINQLCEMVEKGDFTNRATIDAIFAKHKEFDSKVTEVEDEIKRLFGH